MARNRPGKRERINAKRDAFQRERASIMARNAQEAREVSPLREAINARRVAALEGVTDAKERGRIKAHYADILRASPKGLRNSVLARDSLKSASHDIGFVGPRGYHTPSDKVSKRELVPGALIPARRSAQERQEALALAASVNMSRPTQKD